MAKSTVPGLKPAQEASLIIGGSEPGPGKYDGKLGFAYPRLGVGRKLNPSFSFHGFQVLREREEERDETNTSTAWRRGSPQARSTSLLRRRRRYVHLHLYLFLQFIHQFSGLLN